MRAGFGGGRRIYQKQGFFCANGLHDRPQQVLRAGKVFLAEMQCDPCPVAVAIYAAGIRPPALVPSSRALSGLLLGVGLRFIVSETTSKNAVKLSKCVEPLQKVRGCPSFLSIDHE